MSKSGIAGNLGGAFSIIPEYTSREQNERGFALDGKIPFPNPSINWKVPELDLTDVQVRHWENAPPLIAKEKLRQLPPAEIARRLGILGVNLDLQEFRQATRTHLSAEEIYKEWTRDWTEAMKLTYSEFALMAGIVLWEQLAPPGVMSTEQIDDLMQEGYNFFDPNQNCEKACKIWLQVWEMLKKRFRPDINDMYCTDEIFLGSQSIFNWSQDFELALGNAGLHEKRADICRYLYTTFPESFSNYLFCIRRDEAEAICALGRYSEAEHLYQVILQEFPDNPWSYIQMGDFFEDLFYKTQDQAYFEKAKGLFERALGVPPGDEEEIPSAITQRLADLQRV